MVIKSAIRDLGMSFYLAKLDIRNKFRGSTLGPFWNVMTLAVTTIVLSFFYSKVLNQNLPEYTPYLTIGFTLWWFISASLNESGFAFLASSGLIRNTVISPQVLVLRIVFKNLILLIYNFSVVIVVLSLSGKLLEINLLEFFLGIVGLVIFVSSLAMTLSLASVRFKDVPHISANLIQAIFFVTPILFYSEGLGVYEKYASWNIFYILIQLVRAPLLGVPLSNVFWLYAITSILIFSCMNAYIYRRFYKYVPLMV